MSKTNGVNLFGHDPDTRVPTAFDPSPFRRPPQFQPDNCPILPPAPTGPMSWWGRFNQLCQDVRSLITLQAKNPTYYPWIDSPPDAQSFDQQGVIATPGVGTETLVLQMTFGHGWDGCLLGISTQYLGPQSLNYAIPSLVWRIYIDKRPVNGYSNIITQFGSTGFPRPISPILIATGQTLRMTVINNDPALPTAGTFIYGNFVGRMYPHRS